MARYDGSMDSHRNHGTNNSGMDGLNPNKGTKGKKVAKYDRLKQSKLNFASKKADIESEKDDDKDDIYLALAECLPLR